VRRGFSQVVSRAAMRLNALGDTTWLRSRAAVITFEECWPLAQFLSLNREFSSKLDILLRVAKAAKQKDAAGLGALAYAYHEGDRSMLEEVPDKAALEMIAKALDQPKNFFDWVKRESKNQGSTEVIRAAHQYFPAATWQWDKACILAGALLSTMSDLPSVEPLEERVEDEFPYWTALDKHTTEGKAVLKEVAQKVKTQYRYLLWTSFYCESARVNKLLSSPWFEAEKMWRFRRTGLSSNAAEELWSRARPLIREQLETEALSLKKLVESGSLHEPVPRQASFL
jgi:hypothetical protein